MRNEGYTIERIKAIADTGISAFTLLTEEGDADALDTVVDADVFARKLESFVRVGFTAAKASDDSNTPAKRRRGAAVIDFDCSPQRDLP